MDDLIAFLNARLDQDERRAQDAIAVGHRGYFDGPRALREVEAKRAILARYEDCLARMEDPAYSGVAEYVQGREYEDFILPNLAAVYSDHPDYQPEWKP